MYAGSQKPGWAPSGLSIVNEENHPKTRKDENSINQMKKNLKRKKETKKSGKPPKNRKR